MTNDRGEYRAIRRVLLDGPDFQELPERARWVFVVLKVTFGPSGIDVFYPQALLHQLAAQTGASSGDVADALDALEAAGWIRREANVVWIVGQLENDPHIKSKDKNHRKFITQHVNGLPRLEIVRAFVEAHPDFFPPSDGPSPVVGWVSEGPSKGLRSTKGKREDENERELRVVDAPAPKARAVRPPTALPAPPASRPDTWVTRLVDLWQRDVGRIVVGRLGADLKSSVERHSEELVARAMRSFIATQKAAGRSCNFGFFVGEIEVWIQRVEASPYEVIGGEMNDALERATRPVVRHA